MSEFFNCRSACSLKQATQQHEEQHKQQQCTNTTSTWEYAPMQRLPHQCAHTTTLFTVRPKPMHPSCGQFISLSIRELCGTGPYILRVRRLVRLATREMRSSLCVLFDEIQLTQFFPSFSPISFQNSINVVCISRQRMNSQAGHAE